jgi:anthranilate synthase/aminodeoxychorismate synthase-like glutamine amidotransferase
MTRDVLLLDNYDSFTYNLAHGFGALGFTPRVVRADMVNPDALSADPPAALVISPGPGRPEKAGHTVAIVRRLSGRVPVLGVCLGHQAIAVAFGGSVIHAPKPAHGVASAIEHDDGCPFEGVPAPMHAGRYHSLVVDESDLPDELTVCARTDDGLVMALRHKTHPTIGLQFHPESVLTKSGPKLLSNFLRFAGIMR